MIDKEAAASALAICADPKAAATEYDFARAVILTAGVADCSLATAESLTGGLVAEILTSVPGASTVFRGGVVAYTAESKQSLLGVPKALLDRVGTVDAEVALAMAKRAAEVLDVDLAAACTGVAGPEPHGGKPVGEVHLAVFDRVSNSSRTSSLQLGGSRDEIRSQCAISMCGLLIDALLPHAELQQPS